MALTDEQEKVVKSNLKNMVISASAGSGKTFVMIEKLIGLICEKHIPVERMLVLTFTKVASNEMKNRLQNAILSKEPTPFLLEQIDAIPLSDICTIDSFCEKIIKRNIANLDIDENFTILDEKGAKNLKNLAFDRAYQYFIANESEKFGLIYFAFKKNKDFFKLCIYDLQDFFSSIENESETLEKFENNFAEFNSSAQKYILDFLKPKIDKTIKSFNFIDVANLTNKENEIFSQIKYIFDVLQEEIEKTNDLFYFAKKVGSLPQLPALRGKISESVKKVLSDAKDNFSMVKKILEPYINLSDSEIDSIKLECESGTYARAILSFYKKYLEIYSALKLRRSALDFADLESKAKVLLSDESIRKSLAEKYDYIFIDEYQDTNPLQKSIIMPISESGQFVAVGDIKQGIYGFRNASMDIMKQDIEDFKGKSDSDALFLTGNFRTDERILNFINSIFEKIMTISSVGVDYKNTSMLKGLRKFEEGSLPAVSIDVIEPEKKETSPSNGEIYSVKMDNLSNDKRFEREITVIYDRIQDVLLSQIYDTKLEKFRNCEYGDIALLFRGRHGLMEELVRFLRQKGVPVNADISEDLLDEYEIRVVYSLVKISINFNDDISLASVMASPFGNFSMEELAKIRQNSGNNINFYEIISSSNEEKIVAFKNMVNDFKFDTQIFGLSKALNRLFEKYDFKGKSSVINSLFSFIKRGNFDFNLSGFITSIEHVSSKSQENSGGNAITITTIHATKGLEYPIVFLCGAGESLIKTNTKSYVLSKNFGYGSNYYDFENFKKLPLPSFLAGKLEKSSREFIDEIMIFYVALTRAQNHLYIIGSGKESDFSFDELKGQNSYLKLIFYALGENFSSQFFTQEKIETKNLRLTFIGEIEKNFDENLSENTIKNDEEKYTEKYAEELEKYNNFVYKNKNECYLSQKNSVTSALKIYEQNLEENVNKNLVLSSNNAIEVGNSYHEALKLLNFDLISNKIDLEEQKSTLIGKMKNDRLMLIDDELLLKNILILKGVIKGEKVYKERQFIMQCRAEELEKITQNDSSEFKILKEEENGNENTLIVQGIIDLFAVGEKTILIDYKFSSTKDGEELKKRYKQQLELYAMALTRALNKEIDEIYLLSLKYSQLIKII